MKQWFLKLNIFINKIMNITGLYLGLLLISLLFICQSKFCGLIILFITIILISSRIYYQTFQIK